MRLARPGRELLELFRFASADECAAALANAERRQLIEDELADVLFFVVRFAQRFDVDLDGALAHKMQLTAERYPIERSRGKNAKYTELS